MKFKILLKVSTIQYGKVSEYFTVTTRILYKELVGELAQLTRQFGYEKMARSGRPTGSK